MGGITCWDRLAPDQALMFLADWLFGMCLRLVEEADSMGVLRAVVRLVAGEGSVYDDRDWKVICSK